MNEGEPSHGTEMIRQPSSGDGLRSAASCASCGAPKPEQARYCELCGHSADSGPPRTEWVLTVLADRAQFERLGVPDLVFPADRAARDIALHGDAMIAGRSKGSSPVRPDIDLTGDLSDPGVSQRHLSIERHVDGQLHLIDLGSTNGTTLNDAADAIAPGTRVAIDDGDRIQFGAWTTILVRRVPATT